MTPKLKTLLERAETWPETDQDEFAAIAQTFADDVEERRTGVYVISDDEWADLQQGVEQADRCEFVSDMAIAAANKRYGI